MEDLKTTQDEHEDMIFDNNDQILENQQKHLAHAKTQKEMVDELQQKIIENNQMKTPEILEGMKKSEQEHEGIKKDDLSEDTNQRSDSDWSKEKSSQDEQKRSDQKDIDESKEPTQDVQQKSDQEEKSEMSEEDQIKPEQDKLTSTEVLKKQTEQGEGVGKIPHFNLGEGFKEKNDKVAPSPFKMALKKNLRTSSSSWIPSEENSSENKIQISPLLSHQHQTKLQVKIEPNSFSNLIQSPNNVNPENTTKFDQDDKKKLNTKGFQLMISAIRAFLSKALAKTPGILQDHQKKNYDAYHPYSLGKEVEFINPDYDPKMNNTLSMDSSKSTSVLMPHDIGNGMIFPLMYFIRI